MHALIGKECARVHIQNEQISGVYRKAFRQVVTLRRTRLIIISFCVLPATLATIPYSPMVQNYSCITVSSNLDLSYSKIFLTLRRYHSQVQDHVQQPNPKQINCFCFTSLLLSKPAQREGARTGLRSYARCSTLPYPEGPER